MIKPEKVVTPETRKHPPKSKDPVAEIGQIEIAFIARTPKGVFFILPLDISYFYGIVNIAYGRKGVINA